jgi:uncharacterized membrane protein
MELIKKNKELLRIILAACIIFVGVLHFVIPNIFAKLIPAELPYPLSLVYISGFFEILGGIGLLIPPSVMLRLGDYLLFSSSFSQPTSTWQLTKSSFQTYQTPPGFKQQDFPFKQS